MIVVLCIAIVIARPPRSRDKYYDTDDNDNSVCNLYDIFSFIPIVFVHL